MIPFYFTYLCAFSSSDVGELWARNCSATKLRKEIKSSLCIFDAWRIQWRPLRAQHITRFQLLIAIDIAILFCSQVQGFETIPLKASESRSKSFERSVRLVASGILLLYPIKPLFIRLLEERKELELGTAKKEGNWPAGRLLLCPIKPVCIRFLVRRKELADILLLYPTYQASLH